MDDEQAGQAHNCLNCKRPLTVFVPTPSSNEARRAEVTPGNQALDKPSPTNRGLSLTDRGLVIGGLLIGAGLFWYFIGFKLFKGERLRPAGALFFCGLSVLLRNVFKDMASDRQVATPDLTHEQLRLTLVSGIQKIKHFLPILRQEFGRLQDQHQNAPTEELKNRYKHLANGKRKEIDDLVQKKAELEERLKTFDAARKLGSGEKQS
jgi:hypothetical protein